MIRKWKAVLCAALTMVLLMSMSLCAAAQKAMPSPSPTPTAMPRESFRHVGPENHVSVQAYYDGRWNTMKSHMIYKNSPRMMADGMLHFMPLANYVRGQGEKIATVRLTEEFDVRVNIDEGALRSGSFSYAIYRVNGEELELHLREKPVWTQLEKGRYLISVEHSASQGDTSYSGKSFLWLEI